MINRMVNAELEFVLLIIHRKGSDSSQLDWTILGPAVVRSGVDIGSPHNICRPLHRKSVP